MNAHNERTYGLDDPTLLNIKTPAWGVKKWLALFFALIFLVSVWFALDQKLLFGDAWLSDTYDNPDWKTNEGNLHTFGAWDMETHVWKTEYIMQQFPHYSWNPFWYLGMPLLKYYQSGFYLLQILFIMISGVSAARSALLLTIFGHLAASLMTFLLCYKVSKRIWVSALCASFVLTNTFLSLRSYGWEPITVVFLFLYPLGLYLFLKQPLRPLRFWLILTLGISYLCHPLLWFSLCMTMGVYLLSIAIRHKGTHEAKTSHYILQFVALVIASLLIGAVQFIPQITYKQVTSGAHMGVSYLPFYQVAQNIISLKDFLFDAGNLKGPGPIIMIALLLFGVLAYLHYVAKKKQPGQQLHQHELITGLALTLFVMVLFYYLELYNIFPMNILRSIQYHRIIPEFVIAACVLVAALANIVRSHKQKIFYYSMLIAFVCACGIIVLSVQAHWQTTASISSSPEFIHDNVSGRISFPYTDQSLAVRNSFTYIPQTYGYYEQGITNPYADEIFSVSSGYHNANLTTLYLQAADVTRLYVNMEEGERDAIVIKRLNGTLPFVRTNNTRYGYFVIPITNPSFSQAVDVQAAEAVQALEPRCRVLFSERYCGSVKEEFVSTDTNESRYIAAYVHLLSTAYAPSATMVMENPDTYSIQVSGANTSTAIVMKMTYDADFRATIDGKRVPISTIGPYFMLISPSQSGDYTITLQYGFDPLFLVGLIISVLSLVVFAVYFIMLHSKEKKNSGVAQPLQFSLSFKRGDMK